MKRNVIVFDSFFSPKYEAEVVGETERFFKLLRRGFWGKEIITIEPKNQCEFLTTPSL